MLNEPLHPIVQLKLGVNDYLISIPPKYLMDFTCVESRDDAGNVANFVFVDPTFVKVEKLIFETERASKHIKYRWGYPNNGLDRQKWRTGWVTTYQPEISTAGTRINLGVQPVGFEYATLVEPKVYYGRISNAIYDVAIDMGFKKKDIYIEETDDNINEERKQPWPTRGLTRIEFINTLIWIANSKQNPGLSYDFKLNGGEFHFHTANYLSWFLHTLGMTAAELKGLVASNSKKRYRVFKVLFGMPDGAIKFTPRYEGRQMSGITSAALVTTIDPKTKQYQKRLITRETEGLTNKNIESKGAKTSSGPIVSSNKTVAEQESKVGSIVYVPTRQEALGGRCSGKTTHKYNKPNEALKRVSNAFKAAHEQVSGGDLELVGLPKHADFTLDEEYCDIHAVLPSHIVEESIPLQQDMADSYGGLHWSSGRYQIQIITTSISSSYVIQVNLVRSTMLEGPQDAKTGPPRVEQSTQVKTTR